MNEDNTDNDDMPRAGGQEDKDTTRNEMLNFASNSPATNRNCGRKRARAASNDSDDDEDKEENKEKNYKEDRNEDTGGQGKDEEEGTEEESNYARDEALLKNLNQVAEGEVPLDEQACRTIWQQIQPSTQEWYTSEKYTKSWPFSCYPCLLSNAARTENLSVVRFFVDQLGFNVKKEGFDGSGLKVACNAIRRFDLEKKEYTFALDKLMGICQFLLDRGADPNSGTPLRVAISCHQPPLVSLLLQHGALRDPSLLEDEDYGYECPLSLVMHRVLSCCISDSEMDEYIEIIKMFLQYGDFYGCCYPANKRLFAFLTRELPRRDDHKRAICQLFIRNRYASLTKKQEASGGDGVENVGTHQQGVSPVLNCDFSNYVKCYISNYPYAAATAQEFEQRLRGRVAANREKYIRKTALELTRLKRYRPALRMFVECGFNAQEAFELALHHLASDEDEEVEEDGNDESDKNDPFHCCRFLVERLGADPFHRKLRNKNYSAFQWVAAGCGDGVLYREFLQFLLGQWDLRFHLTNGKDPNGDFPLHLACRDLTNLSIEAINIMLSHKSVALETVDGEEGFYPFQLVATRSAKLDFIYTLLRRYPAALNMRRS